MPNGVIHVSDPSSTMMPNIDTLLINNFPRNLFTGKILTPKMAELLGTNDDIDLAVIDVDTNVELVNTFEVKAVPAVLAFRNGVIVDKFIGLVDSKMIESLISKLQKNKSGDT